MGIDAEMLIRRVPQSVVTDEWLKAVSWRLCQAIGAEKFFISDGLSPAEYEAASKAWHAAFNAHRLYPEWDSCRGGNDSKWRDLRAQIVADIGEAPKERRLAIERTLTRYRDDGDPPPGSVYRQDGDDVPAEGNECLLELSLWGRYYGPGYERGDILTYCAIAEWLEMNVPGCEVWYGGDSSGVCAAPFHALKRLELRQHLYSSHGRDYFAHENPYMDNDGIPKPAACSLCPSGKYCGSRHGWGNGYAAFSCAGCGKCVETRDSGSTWQERKND